MSEKVKEAKKYHSSFHTLPEVIKAYCMIQWILAYKQELNGYGMPFDRSDFVFCQRIQKAHDSLQGYPREHEVISELQCFLSTFIEDPSFKAQMQAMARKVVDFDRLREIMRIAPTMGLKGLNDDGEECDMTIMESELKAFIESPTVKNSQGKDYRKMISQIKKYWKMLFAKPVKMCLPNGDTIWVYPGRTSNLMERLFREFQRLEYKRTGMGTLGRTARAMISETPMMKNLETPEYMKIILNGQPTLAARFAELDSKRIQERIAKEGSWKNVKLPTGLKKIMRDPNFYRVAGRAAEVFNDNEGIALVG